MSVTYNYVVKIKPYTGRLCRVIRRGKGFSITAENIVAVGPLKDHEGEFSEELMTLRKIDFKSLRVPVTREDIISCT